MKEFIIDGLHCSKYFECIKPINSHGPICSYYYYTERLNKLSKATNLFVPNQPSPALIHYPIPSVTWEAGGKVASGQLHTQAQRGSPDSQSPAVDEKDEGIYTVSSTLSSEVPGVCKNIKGLLMMVWLLSPPPPPRL